ncbi:MAG: DUF4058 family protein [Isosphaeraceae bacterium]
MPSPFPGMDPYLEAPGVWPDFHATFLQAWREAISIALPDGYEAWIDERVQLVSPDEIRQLVADVGISRHPGDEDRPPIGRQGGIAVLEPVSIPVVMLDQPRESFIRIVRRPDRELVTVVELLSPANRAGADHSAYLVRRSEIYRQGAHLVELDLLMKGHRLPMGRPLPKGDYYAFVARSERLPDCDVYAWSVRRALPSLPIPLKAPDPDIFIDLAEVFATAYARGPYARSLDDASPAQAQLAPEDADWAAETARR